MQELEIPEMYKKISDEELVLLCREGIQDAFAALSVRYIYVIKGKAADFKGMAVEDEDLFQEGLIGLDNAVKSFDSHGSASFRTYAGVCIRNRIISAVRKANSSSNAIHNSAPPLSEQTDAPSAPFTEPENAVVAVEKTGEIFKVIRETLSELERNVLSLYLDGKSYEEIAGELNISKKTCDNAMQRVRRKLKFLK